MSETYTLTLSGTSSTLEAYYFPPIELNPNKNWFLGLIQLLTFNSIPNVDHSNNKFHLVGESEPILIPTGSYEIEDINRYLQGVLGESIITIKPNNNTLRSEVTCERPIDFRPEGSIGRLLGFTPQILSPSETHRSDSPVAILKINALRVECNLTSGSYINSQKVHTIHEFFPLVPPGYKIVEVPSHVIYLPITTNIISYVQLRIVDQNGQLIDFQGETITIRLHLKTL